MYFRHPQAAAGAAEVAKQAGAKAKGMLEVPAHESMAKTSGEAQVKTDPEVRHSPDSGELAVMGSWHNTDGLGVQFPAGPLDGAGPEHVVLQSGSTKPDGQGHDG